MTQWHRAAAVDDVPEDAPLALTVDGREIALYRLDDGIHAAGDICPHQKDVRLSGGYLDGATIECPMHQSCFDVRTGKVLGPPAREDIPVFRIRIEDGEVFVEV
jgi:nitrite reductase/ring-hydroxylating ferredoxin subunit